MLLTSVVPIWARFGPNEHIIIRVNHLRVKRFEEAQEGNPCVQLSNEVADRIAEISEQLLKCHHTDPDGNTIGRRQLDDSRDVLQM